MVLRRFVVLILGTSQALLLAACPPAVTSPPPSGACPLADDQPFTLAGKVTDAEFLAVDGERVYCLPRG